jgi:hypothetical protein
MAGIRDDSAPDYKIDSARRIVPITLSDTEDFGDCARGIWLNEITPKKINYHEDTGTEREQLMLLPGPNMFLCRRILETGTDPGDYRAIY